MNDIIHPYTPLYRKQVDNCAKCEPINILIGEDFNFLMPYPEDMGTVTYQLLIMYNDIQYTIEYEILEDALNGGNICRILWNEDGSITGQSVTFGQPNIDIPTAKLCTSVSLVTQLILFPDIIISSPINTYTFKFITQNLCNSYVRLDYYLDCNQPLPYTYWLKGSFRRQPQLLADEINFVTPSGGTRRIYSRYIKPYLLKSFAFGWDEHDFLEVITCSYALEVNGIAYQPTEGGVWTVNTPTTAYSTGQMELVEGGRIVATCCDVTDESSSPA